MPLEEADYGMTDMAMNPNPRYARDDRLWASRRGFFPPLAAQMDLVALVAYLVSEGWQASTTEDRVEVVYNGTSYTRTKQWLAQCDFTNVPGPLAFDVQQGLALQGFCIAP